MTMTRRFFGMSALAAGALSTLAAYAQAVPDFITRALADPARLPEDRETDHARRYPAMLTFWGIKPGMVLLDFFGAHGITTEVLARAVGPRGTVYLQNPAWYFTRFTPKLVEAHLANNRLPNVVRMDAEFTQIPLPANSVDGVVMHLIFHDLFWMEPQNVPKIVADMYKITKPGGFLGLADHDAPAGAGISLAGRGGKHRIEASFARKLFTDAGFVFEAESQALRNPKDDRATTALESPIFHGDTDRFLMRFRKPLK